MRYAVSRVLSLGACLGLSYLSRLSQGPSEMSSGARVSDTINVSLTSNLSAGTFN